LDAALERGALTLRGYDRVLRVAWTLADLDGRTRLEPRDIGKALFMKKGIAA
jgi:magnesium chelatase family protein